MSDSKSDVGRMLAELQRKLELRAGETAMDLWRLFKAMRPEDCKSLHDWINTVAPLASTMQPCNLMTTLEVTLRYPIGPDEDIRLDGVPVGVVKWVLDGFQQGQKPRVPSLRDLGFSV